ncbi:hypothetical protein GCM10028822_23170 [Hymenobacter terrigena]
MPVSIIIKPYPEAAPPEQFDATAAPWPSDVPLPLPADAPPPLPDDVPPDDTLTEAAGMARNDDALGPYAGSF